MTDRHTSLATLIGELRALVGEHRSGANPAPYTSESALVERLEALLDEHPADLPVATDSTTAAGFTRLSVLVNDDCAAHLAAMGDQGMPATEVVRRALSLHAFVQDGGRIIPPASEPSNSTTAEIEDGFGAAWTTCGPDCDLQVVRPGKVQCNHTSSTCPDAPAPEPSDRAGLSEIRARIERYRREWLWQEADEEHVARWGFHIGQMLYRLPKDGQTTDMQASIEAMIADLGILADRLAVAEQERTEERGDLLRAGEEWMGDALCAEARAEGAEQEAATLRDQVAAVAALLPAECWISRTPDIRCIDYVGDAFPDGSPFAEDACCLPCRLRAALGDSAQVVQRITDEAAAAAAALVEAEVESEVKRLTTAECPDPWKEPMLGNWLGGMQTAAKVIRGERS